MTKNKHNSPHPTSSTENGHNNPGSIMPKIRDALLALPIFLTLTFGSPENVSGKTTKPIKPKGYDKELAINLGDSQIDNENDDPEKIEKTKHYIGNYVYIYGTPVKDLKNVNIEEKGYNIYSVEFEHQFKEGPKKVVIKVSVNYTNNSKYLNIQDIEIPELTTKDGKPINLFGNNSIEIDSTHNVYDVTFRGDTQKSVNFNIIYNDYKTQDTITKIIRNQDFGPTKNFEEIEELENTQLTGLNNPILGKEVFKDGDLYYRTLYYSTNGKKIDVTNVYFTKIGEIDVGTTNEKKQKLIRIGIDIDYEITEKGEFIISETSKQELIEKVKQHRAVLIDMINNTDLIAPDRVFVALNKKEDPETYNSPTLYLYLNPVDGTYHIELHEGKLEPLHFIFEGDSPVLVSKTKKTINEFYANYTIEEDNNYKFTQNGKVLEVEKVGDKIDNPKEVLPCFTGDQNAINIIKSEGTLTNYDQYLNFYNDGILITKIPCDKQEDETYKYNNEKKHTIVEAIKLYRYPGFKNITQEITTLATNLGITDAEIRKIFEESLKNDGFQFEQKVIEIKNPKTGISIYYNIDGNFNISLDKTLYEQAEKRLNFIKKRLELVEIISNRHIKWKNGYQYKDFEENFNGGEIGIVKQIILPEPLEKFVFGKSNEITIRIFRGRGQHTDITLAVNKHGGLSINQTGNVYLNKQRYDVKIITDKEAKKINKKTKRNGKEDSNEVANGNDIVMDPTEE